MSLKSKPFEPTKTALYALIETGQMARNTLARPLNQFGLVVGDDAVILALSSKKPATDSQLQNSTGLPPGLLLSRLERLIRLDMVKRIDPETSETSGTLLTEQGDQIRLQLVEHWQALEDALLGELKKKQKRKLRNALSRFANLLSRQS